MAGTKAPAQPKPEKPAKQTARPGVEVGDHVYTQHPERGPIAVRVASVGADGIHGDCDQGKRWTVPWDRVLGHRARMLHTYRMVEQGADGALLQGRDGKRRYLEGQLPRELSSGGSGLAEDTPEPAAAADDPLTGRQDKLRKATMIPDGCRVLFLKAQIRGAHTPDLFDAPVLVAPHVRGGKIVRGYMTHRKKAREAEEAGRWDEAAGHYDQALSEAEGLTDEDAQRLRDMRDAARTRASKRNPAPGMPSGAKQADGLAPHVPQARNIPAAVTPPSKGRYYRTDEENKELVSRVRALKREVEFYSGKRPNGKFGLWLHHWTEGVDRVECAPASVYLAQFHTKQDAKRYVAMMGGGLLTGDAKKPQAAAKD